jgi:hypothetical protein
MTLPWLSNEHSPRTKGGRRVEHVYAIVRVDEFLGSDIPIERRITVKKVMRDADEAEREVERLNRLQRDAGVRYFAQITRLEQTDQAPPAEETARQTNRISAFVSGQAADVVTANNQEWLETVRVPEGIYLPPPQGFGFPAVLVYEVCGNPSSTHEIKWEDLNFSIFSKFSTGYVDVVGVQEQEGFKTVGFAFRVFPDFCETPLGELTPLMIVERMADRFGLTMMMGSVRGKFFLEREFPISGIPIPGSLEGPVIRVENPENRAYLGIFSMKFSPPTVRIALAFCLDIMKYWQWLKNR